MSKDIDKEIDPVWFEFHVSITKAMLTGTIGKAEPVHFENRKRHDELREIAVKRCAEKWGAKVINNHVVGRGVIATNSSKGGQDD